MKNDDISKLSSGGDYGSLKMQSFPGRGKEADHGQGGFTLVELLTVSAILGLIMAIAIPSYNQFIGTVRITKAVAELSALERDIVAYEVDKGTLPDSLSDFGRDTLLDPWGRPYVYLKLTAPNTARNDAFRDLNEEFDCYSVGADGLTARLTNDPVSRDDVVRGADGAYYGLAAEF